MNTTPETSIEIMAPAGSYEALRAAIQGGADSVYFGAGTLNMRSRSSANFTLEDLTRIAAITKENNVRSYLTVNTIIYDNELQYMRQVIDTAKAAGIDAVIASDTAVLQYAKEKGVEIHLSTQCNVTNSEAVRYYSRFADVIVTARELSLSQVKAITDYIRTNHIVGPSGHPVQIEIFAHGALCMAVSGKCYLSLDNANSSANRGACLQFCRRPYKVTDLDGGTELVVDNEYIMSPKDLKTIDFLDRILDAGVSVLKIEGRGRSPEYVKTVTRVYREAADACMTGSFTPEKLTEWNNRLASVYNRGFWDGYYLGQTMGEWTDGYGSQATQHKEYVGLVTNYFKQIGVAEITMNSGQLNLGDDILIIGPTTGVYEDTLTEIRVDLRPVKTAEKSEICSIPTREIVRRGDKVYKIIHKQQTLP